MSSDWRPANQIPEPPAGATPLAPASIREKKVEEAEIVNVHGVEAKTIKEAAAMIPDDGGFKGLPVRVAGDKIWLLKGGRRSWVTSADVYTKLGFKFGDEKDIDAETLMLIPEGLPLK